MQVQKPRRDVHRCSQGSKDEEVQFTGHMVGRGNNPGFSGKDHETIPSRRHEAATPVLLLAVLNRPGRNDTSWIARDVAISHARASGLAVTTPRLDMVIVTDLNALPVDALDFTGASNGWRHQQGKHDGDCVT